MNVTPPFLEDLAAQRQTVILSPPNALARELRARKVGVLPLWRLTDAHLVKGHQAPRDAWLAVVWSPLVEGFAYYLQAVTLTWRRAEVGTGLEVPALNMGQRITAHADGPRAVLEAVAVVVAHQLEAEVWRRKDGAPERRRVKAVKLNLARQVLVAHDLDRDAARSFRLEDLVAVQASSSPGGRP